MTWAAVFEVARWVVPFGGAAALWWVRDRRKDRAAADVAERTVPAEVALKDIGTDQARLVYIQQEMNAERQFHRQQLADRDGEIDRQRGELAHRDDLIASLRVEAENLREQLAQATRQLASVLARLDELADVDQQVGVPHPRGER